VTVAAMALALALVVAPGEPRRRFGSQRSPGQIRRAARRVGAIVGAVAIAVVAPVTATVALGVVAATFMLRRKSSRGRARRVEESAALQGALSVLVGELRVGAHPVIAFESAAAEVDGIVAESMRAVAARARLGADVAAGLRSVAGHSTVPGYWERLSVCWLLAQTRGLAIVALVRAAQRDIIERERFASSVSAGMAGARATAAILAGLPVLGVGLGQLIGAEPLRFLLAGGVGGWLLLIGVALACAGLWWSDRITDRVLR
jgi:tight adherence protein B